MNNKIIIWSFLLLSVITFALATYLYYLKSSYIKSQNSAKVNSYTDSVYKNNSEILYTNLIKSFREGNKHDQKTYLYWFWQRYYDNGLDIREIVNFIDNNPELYFLKEAENFYPELFKKVKNNNKDSLSRLEKELIHLSYAEIIIEKDLDNLAMLGSVANNYLSVIPLINPDIREEYVSKSIYYYDKLIQGLELENKVYINSLLSSSDYIEQLDFLIGLNKLILLDTAFTYLDIVHQDINTEEIYMSAKTLIGGGSKELLRLESVTDMLFAMNISIRNNVSLKQKYQIDDLLSGIMIERNRNGSAIISKNRHNIIYNENIIKSLMRDSEVFKVWLISKNPEWAI